MRTAMVPLLAAATMLLVPLAASAEVSAAPAAAQNCAQALAERMHMPLGPVHYQPNFNPIVSTSGLVDNELLLHARSYEGRLSPPMICRYDRNGQVVSLRPVSPIDTVPSVNGN